MTADSAGVPGNSPAKTAPDNVFIRILRGIEKYGVTAIVALLILIPAVETVLRLVRIPGMEGIQDVDKYIQHIVLALAFIGGMITTREKQHLAIGVLVNSLKNPWDRIVHFFNALIAGAICITLSLSAVSLLVNAFSPAERIGFIPIHVFLVFLPIGYLVMGVRFILTAKLGARGRLIALVAAAVAGGLIAFPSIIETIVGKPAILANEISISWTALHQLWHSIIKIVYIPGLIILIFSAFTGTPLFLVLGGVALLLFAKDFQILSTGSLTMVPNAVYDLLKGKYIPAIPLFAFVGFILAESKAGERLMRLFRALLGFIPGGIVIMVVIVSAYFTTFTGASGITILALGTILFVALSKQGNYGEDFSTGLLTSSGSIGLLFPPSLPLILYGSIAQINILDMFAGSIIPGIVMVVIMSVTGIILSMRKHIPPVPFKPIELFKCLKESIWEVLIPFFVIIPFFFGLTKLVETSAILVIYVLIVEVFIHREIKPRDLPGIAVKGAIIMGGVLVIIGTAQAFADYIIDQQIPMLLRDWMKTAIQSPVLFLLMLNVALLITGCFMDIYAALIVVVPLIVPLGVAFGIDPVHLGIIFIVNMEIGFLTPPIGLNLFLSSYCFQKPIGRVYRDTLPFFLLQIGVLFLITYTPLIFNAVCGLFTGGV